MILLHRPSKTTSPSTDYINTPKFGDYTEPLERGQISTSPYQTFSLSLSLSLSPSFVPSIDHFLLSRALFAPQSIILGDFFLLWGRERGGKFFQRPRHQASGRVGRLASGFVPEFSKSWDAISGSCLPLRGGVSANSALSHSPSVQVCVFRVGLLRNLTSPAVPAAETFADTSLATTCNDSTLNPRQVVKSGLLNRFIRTTPIPIPRPFLSILEKRQVSRWEPIRSVEQTLYRLRGSRTLGPIVLRFWIHLLRPR